MYENFHKEYDFTTYVSDELYEYDEIFCQYNLPGPNGRLNTITADSTYHQPDRAQYIFSTNNLGCYVLYSNNMVSPIRRKHALENSHAIKNRLKLPIKDSPSGVFIVEYYRVNKMIETEENLVQSIIDYYQNVKTIYPNNVEIINKIRDQMYPIRLKTGHFGWRDTIVLRVVTYIPQSDLAKHSNIYVPSCDLVIGCGTVHPTLVSPCSKQFQEYRQTVYSDVKNFIEIDIVDFSNRNDYYINVGNKVLGLQPCKDPSRKEGCYVNIYKNQTMVDSFESSLVNTGEEHGIYKTYEEARYAGDLSKRNESMKLEVEKERIGVDIERLNVEKIKLGNELEKARMELDATRAKIQHEEYKMQVDIRLAKEKATMGHIDYLKKVLDLYTARVRAEADIIIATETPNSNKARLAQEKVKNSADIASRLINLTTSLGKLYLSSKAS